MKGERSKPLRRFRRKRVIIPLLAVAALITLGLGGYKGIVSFAMDEMTGFLVGTGGPGDDGLLAKAAPKAEAKAAPARAEVQVSPQAAPRRAEASGAAADGQEPMLLAQSPPAGQGDERLAERDGRQRFF